jgi:hypothetical protein
MKRSSPLLGLSREHHEALVLARRAASTLPTSETAHGQREHLLTRWDEQFAPHFAIEEEVLLPALAAAGQAGPATAALAHLYPRELPQRGGIRVELRGAQEEGVVGVVASVATLITGATGPGGFKGLAGRHVRRGLLSFGVPMRGEMRFTRADTQAAVEVSFHLDALPRSPALGGLMQAGLAPGAPAEAREAFAHAWQERVRAILLDHADDPELVSVE